MTTSTIRRDILQDWTVVVVDDEPDSLEVATRILRFYGANVHTATNGEEGLAIIRSLSTSDNTHDSSGYWLWTGYKYVGPNSRTIQPTDWPYFGSLVKKFKPSEKLPPLSTVWLPESV